jgi:hypothetical protein
LSSPSKLAVAGIGDPGREAGLIISSSSLASSLASTHNAVHKHLRRLERVWIDRPMLIDEWRYVIMPDRAHFFCRAELDAKSLPIFMQKWKQWSSNEWHAN